jgi:predicted O-methyltransferase YrrM
MAFRSAGRGCGKILTMFESISPAMLSRMRELEAIDLRDRTDGTPHGKRLRQVTPEVGKLIAMLAAWAPAGPCIEIGTSAGYSTLWLAMAARATGRRVTTYEFDGAKVELARATFAAAGVADVIDLVHGDAVKALPECNGIGFCFIDGEKDFYLPCYELAVPRMVSGGILIADNTISHEHELRPMVERALSDERVDAVLVPIGYGDLICRKK